MKHDKTHTSEYSVVNLFNKLIGNLFMRNMTPPNKNIGIFEHLVREAALRHIKRCAGYVYIFIFAEKAGNTSIYSVRIDSKNIVLLILNMFIPYSYINHS